MATVSPWFISSVCELGVNVLTSVSCGLGGPVGTPLRCRKAKFTGSSQAALRPTKLNCDSRLSMVSAAHQCLASQLGASTNGWYPGG